MLKQFAEHEMCVKMQFYTMVSIGQKSYTNFVHVTLLILHIILFNQIWLRSFAAKQLIQWCLSHECIKNEWLISIAMTSVSSSCYSFPKVRNVIVMVPTCNILKTISLFSGHRWFCWSFLWAKLRGQLMLCLHHYSPLIQRNLCVPWKGSC